MISIFTKAAVFLGMTLGTLSFALIYKAYVLNHPCEHKLKKLDEANRFKLRDETVDRLRQALAYATVSYDVNTQNESALFDYINFIRKGNNSIHCCKKNHF
jgi:hypothetical protein